MTTPVTRHASGLLRVPDPVQLRALWLVLINCLLQRRLRTVCSTHPEVLMTVLDRTTHIEAWCIAVGAEGGARDTGVELDVVLSMSPMGSRFV